MTVQRPHATFIVVSVTMGMLMACGTVGSPIPPERVGVTPTIERQKRIEALEKKQHDAAAAAESTEPQPGLMLQGQDVDLPSVQPVGTP